MGTVGHLLASGADRAQPGGRASLTPADETLSSLPYRATVAGRLTQNSPSSYGTAHTVAQASTWEAAQKIESISITMDASRVGMPAKDTLMFAWYSVELGHGGWLPPQARDTEGAPRGGRAEGQESTEAEESGRELYGPGSQPPGIALSRRGGRWW